MNIISMQTVTANFAESHEPKRAPSMAGPWQFDREIFNVQCARGMANRGNVPSRVDDRPRLATIGLTY